VPASRAGPHATTLQPMSTRIIVTSQPDVACFICERRLLRGEQPESFLVDGAPQTVCELCAPRAAHQGWKRGSAEHVASAAPTRTRRARGLLERLRGTRRAELDAAALAAEHAGAGGVERADADAFAGRDAFAGAEEPPYDFFTVEAIAGPGASLDAQAAPAGADAPELADPASEERAGGLRGASPGAAALQHALDAFNAGEYPRRVASLARSLGAPEVTVRPGEAVATCVVIVVAWELCWYSYEVDLDDMQGTDARAVAQGTELSELDPGDRLANARADERGRLALL
jgi:hypothetical protein